MSRQKPKKLNWKALTMLLLMSGEEEKYPSLATERALISKIMRGMKRK